MRARLLVALVGSLACTPAAASAQACAATVQAKSAAAVVGAVRYAVAGDANVDGIEVGGEVRVRPGRVALRAGVHHAILSGSRANPTMLRAEATYPLATLLGLDFCGVGLAGGSRFAVEGDRSVALAGGGGLTVARPVGLGTVNAVPFLGVRALAGSAVGSVLDVSFTATAFSLGVEGGVAVRLGRGHLLGALSLDGFAEALGPTAFPGRAVRIGAGVRF